MPSRKKPSIHDTTLAVRKTLLEWGIQPTRTGLHSHFSREISTQTLRHASEMRGQTIVDDDRKEFPRDREDAIQVVFTEDLRSFLNTEIFDLRSREVLDLLKFKLSPTDEAQGILQLPPYYVKDNFSGPTSKPSFLKFAPPMLDPFNRFDLQVIDVSPAQLAYNHGMKESWQNGYSFEAIVASHAIHHETCFRCCKRSTLRWCGGAQTSWRDLYCISCQSCFEIKSKKDRKAIDRIFKFDKLHGGSYRGWCEEDFSSRIQGSDYVVLVNRTPSIHKNGGKICWTVEIAEVGTVLPCLCDRSFVDMGRDYRTVKTVLTLRNRCMWFQIPVKDQRYDLRMVFQRSFNEVFPGEWSKVSRQSLKSPPVEKPYRAPSLKVAISSKTKTKSHDDVLDHWMKKLNLDN